MLTESVLGVTYQPLTTKEVVYGQFTDEEGTMIFIEILRHRTDDLDWGPWYVFENTELGSDLFDGTSFDGYDTLEEAQEAVQYVLQGGL